MPPGDDDVVVVRACPSTSFVDLGRRSPRRARVTQPRPPGRSRRWDGPPYVDHRLDPIVAQRQRLLVGGQLLEELEVGLRSSPWPRMTVVHGRALAEPGLPMLTRRPDQVVERRDAGIAPRDQGEGLGVDREQRPEVVVAGRSANSNLPVPLTAWYCTVRLGDAQVEKAGRRTLVRLKIEPVRGRRAARRSELPPVSRIQQPADGAARAGSRPPIGLPVPTRISAATAGSAEPSQVNSTPRTAE